MADGETCVFCKYLEDWQNHSSDNSITNVTARGIATIVEVSRRIRKDDFHDIIEGCESIKVHEKCRCRYIRPGSTPEAKHKRLRVDNNSHDVEPVEVQADLGLPEKCVICAKNIYPRTPSSSSTSEDTRQKVIEYLQEIKDSSTMELSVRDQILDSLLNPDDSENLTPIKYHRTCFKRYLCKQKSYERLFLQRIEESMEQIFNHMGENPNKEFHTVDFQKLLQEKDMVIPTEKTIWSRIKDHFKQDIVCGGKRGAGIYCCSKDRAFNVLQQNHQQCADDEDKDFELLDKVAKILVEDIRGYQSNWETYPASDRMMEKAKIIPEKPKYFIEKLFLNQYRKTHEGHESEIFSIAHAIMCATLPRKILSPIQVAFGVTLHRKFGSRELVEMCHAMGFCCSYAEVRNYEISATMQGQINVKENAFVQFVHDNADWNVETLDGKGTFHSLGGCEIITPGSYLLPKKPVPRLTRVTEVEIAAESKIKLLDYPHHAMDGMKFFNFPQANPHLSLKLTESSKINCFWMFNKYVRPSFEKGWNGYIENLTADRPFELSVINFLPFIHAYPSEYNTLYTALNLFLSFPPSLFTGR